MGQFFLAEDMEGLMIAAAFHATQLDDTCLHMSVLMVSMRPCIQSMLTGQDSHSEETASIILCV